MNAEPSFCPTCRMTDWPGPMNDLFTAEQTRRMAAHPHHNGAVNDYIGIDAADLAVMEIPPGVGDSNPDDGMQVDENGYLVDDEPDLLEQIAARRARVEQVFRDQVAKYPRGTVQEIAALAGECLGSLGIEVRPASKLLTIAADAKLGKGPFAGAIGTRTALDLLFGDPPDPLVPPFLTPEGPVVIYGKGGTGKGLVICYLMKRLVEVDHVVLLVDFEGHEREWGFRLRGLGLTDEQLGRIHYRAPFGRDWTAATGSLAAVAELLHEDAARLGATYLAVDSYTVATSTGDTLGGMVAAQEYFNALTRVGLPSATIAHVAGASGRFPDRPFGSVFVHNLARETWAVEQAEGSEDETDPDLIRIGPRVVSLELRNKKQNDRPKSPPQFMSFSFFGDGTIEVNRDGSGQRSLADLAAGILAATPDLDTKAIAAAIKEDTGRTVDPNDLRKALTRDVRRFLVTEMKRPHKWSLKGPGQ
jgi:hypothetical protein